MKPETDLDRRIIAATDRPHVARARKWRPRFDKLPICEQWDQAVRETLASAEYLARKKAEREARGR
jgi:hypothetical protein